MWVSHQEELWGDGVGAPPVCDHMVILHGWVVLDGCNPSGAAVDASRDAAARARRAERVVDSGVVSVLETLHRSPSAPRINAQRVVQFDHYRTRNCLPPKKLRQAIQ